MIKGFFRSAVARPSGTLLPSRRRVGRKDLYKEKADSFIVLHHKRMNLSIGSIRPISTCQKYIWERESQGEKCLYNVAAYLFE